MKVYRTVKAALQDKNGNVLLLRRSATHPTQRLHMDLPGGIVEPDEQPVDTLAREIEEETGIKIAQMDLKLFFAYTEDFDGKNAVRLVYGARIPQSAPNVELSWEHDQYQWLPLEEAIEKLPEGRYTRRGLQHLKDKDIAGEL